MNNLKHILIGGVVAASVLAPSAIAAAQAAPASAALSFTTVETLGQAGHEGKQQACKLLVTIASDTYWKINNRLDGRTLRGGSLHATMSVYRGSTKTSRVWQSGEVKPGGLSAVGSILLPHPQWHPGHRDLAGHDDLRRQLRQRWSARPRQHRPLLIC